MDFDTDHESVTKQVDKYFTYLTENTNAFLPDDINDIVDIDPSSFKVIAIILSNDAKEKIRDDNIVIKDKFIDIYIDKNIKIIPANNKTATLKFSNPENTIGRHIYYMYQDLLKIELGTKKIGLNEINWGYFGIVTNGLSALFQMYTLYKTRSAKSFSMPFIWIMTLLNAVYCLVGILENNIGLAVATFFFVIYNFTVIYVNYKYK